MKVVTYEAVVEDGKVSLPKTVHLPERARVYVLVPQPDEPPGASVHSPRLAHPEQASDFVKEVIE